MVTFTFTNITPWAAYHGFKKGEVFEVTELLEGDDDAEGYPTYRRHLPRVSLYRPSNGITYILSNCDNEGEISYS